jgi:voltage-gated potassium channel
MGVPMNRFRIFYEIFSFFLILFYITLIIVSYSGSAVLTQQQVKGIDSGFVIYLMIEYLIRLYRAPQKGLFVKQNFFDLIAMIPFDYWFRVARLMRVLRLLRIIKLSKTIQGIFKSAGLKYVFAFAGLIMTWGTISFYILEKGTNPNINSMTDAIWWTFVTVTTVGYGDILPMTPGGRSIAVILMFVGIGLIGSITGTIAMYFTNLNQVVKEEKNHSDPNNELKTYIESQIIKIDQLNDDEIEHLLASIRILHDKNTRNASIQNESIDEML